LAAGPSSQKINELLNKLLCEIDASNLPYTVGSALGTTIKSTIDATNLEVAKKVNRTGDTMTGALVVNPSPAVPTALDVIGTLQTQQFKLTAPSGTTNKAVLTYESTTGFAKWMETSLTAWQLTGGNLSTDAASVTGSVTINRPTTITSNLQVNGTLNGRTVNDANTLEGKHASEFAPVSHNHDASYLSLVFNNQQEYAPGVER